jgi:hypothetical protein
VKRASPKTGGEKGKVLSLDRRRKKPSPARGEGKETK